MRRAKGCWALFAGLCLVAAAWPAWGAEADVLPAGVNSVGVEYRYYLPIDERYGPDGDREDAAIDYNVDLGSAVFPDLALLELGLGLPPGSATIGASEVEFDYRFHRFDVFYGRGLSDRLTLGVTIPLWSVKNKVSARLNTDGATVGKNPLYGTPGDPAGVPLVPIAFGGVPLTTEETKDLLSEGLDVNGDGAPDIPGFGYERFATNSYTSVGDVEVGARYQYHQSADWRLAVTGGVVLPTGKKDDPDSLVDYGIGTGAYALSLRLGNDYTGVKNLVLSAALRYDLVLPDREVMRVPEDVNEPITANREKVDRDVGDTVALDLSGSYAITGGLGVALAYKYAAKGKDDVDGDMGFNYQSLEDETDTREHVVTVGVSYSTLPLFEQKKFPVPLDASITYRNRVAGENLFASRYVALGVGVYF